MLLNLLNFLFKFLTIKTKFLFLDVKYNLLHSTWTLPIENKMIVAVVILITTIYGYLQNNRTAFSIFTALGLRAAMDNMSGYEDEALQIQIAAFEEHRLVDEEIAPPKSHHQLLDALLAKVTMNLFTVRIFLTVYFCSKFYL